LLLKDEKTVGANNASASRRRRIATAMHIGMAGQSWLESEEMIEPGLVGASMPISMHATAAWCNR